MKKVFAIFAVLILPAFIYANNCATSDNSLTIFYGNGMFNEQDAAKKSLKSLKLKLKDQLPNYEVTFDLAYNQSEGQFEQLYEVFRQQEIEDKSSFYRWLSGISIAPDWFQTAMRDLARETDALIYIIDEDLLTHVNHYLTEIENCRKVMIVAHSQGNFYANSAWDIIYANSIRDIYELENIPVLGLLSVATPADHVGSFLKTPDDHKSITS